MKQILFLILLSCISHHACAQNLKTHWARKYGALAKECLKVVDQDGEPVADARVWGGLATGDGLNDFIPINGVTDTNGEFVIEGNCTHRIRCDITLNGYYSSEFLLDDYCSSHASEDGKWIPYGSNHRIVLNKIVNPYKLKCHDGLEEFKIPVYNQWIGFDFETFDFVSPYGRGIENDVLLKITQTKKSRLDNHVTMEISFTNNPYAGAYEMKKNIDSELQSVYHANTNAMFQTRFVYQFDRWPGKLGQYEKQLNEDEYLVFRTRTKIDHDGNLVTAHYGKIYGKWKFVDGGVMSFHFLAFNSHPNDTNLEDLETANRSIKMRKCFEQHLKKKGR